MDSVPVFNHTKHKELWQWLSEHPEMDKKDVFIVTELLSFPAPRAYCYACQACKELMLAERRDTSVLDCSLCPLEWPDSDCEFSDFSRTGLYSRWEDLKTTLAERADLARQIRDLPVKPDWHGKII